MALVAVTIAVLGYNQENTIEAAIRSAFEQDYENLDILLSDDCSADKTFDRMAELAQTYLGPHRVLLNRNTTNQGIAGHINHLLEISANELVVLNAGDDMSLPHRVSALTDCFLRTHPRPLLIHSQAISMFGGREMGELHPSKSGRYELKDLVKMKNYYLGCTAALTKELHNIYGPLSMPSVIEDVAEGFRAAALSRLSYIEEPLVIYRHDNGRFSSINRFTYPTPRGIKAEKSRAAELRVVALEQRQKDLDCLSTLIEQNSLELAQISLSNEIEKARKNWRLFRLMQEETRSSRRAERQVVLLMGLIGVGIVWAKRIFAHSRYRVDFFKKSKN